jgi:MFS transporter, ceroid-lipofuscinosis neuronal protein 7
VGLADAISFMVVAPSLVFYVTEQLGGSNTVYGIILSAFSFMSFCGKPTLGYWSDATGGTFRKPYLCSIVIAGVGGILYFVASQDVVIAASSSDTKTLGLALVLVGRLLGGVGAANATLGFSYIALVVPPSQLTQAS